MTGNIRSARGCYGRPVLNGGGEGSLVHGALAGAVGWCTMDQALQLIYDRHSDSVRRRESEARGGVPALEVLADRLAGGVGRPLSVEQRQTGGKILQWAVGIGAGMGYSKLRQHLPGHRLWRGLGYGAALWLWVDEGLVPLLGLSPRAGAFPWQTHARGFVGHVVFGLTAEVALELFAWIRTEKHAPSGTVTRGSMVPPS